MFVVGIETSTRGVGAALRYEGITLATTMIRAGARGSSLLPGLVERLLDACDLALGDLDLVAVSHGPGSFTGIRIGCAFGAGLARSLGVPAVGVDTLCALAISLPLPSAPYVVSAIGARRGAFFTAAYGRPQKRQDEMEPEGFWWPEEILPPARRTPAETIQSMCVPPSDCLWLSDEPIEDTESGCDWAGVVSGFMVSPAAVAYLGERALGKGAGGDPILLVPRYYRQTQVKRRNPEGDPLDAS